jgi:beta-glucosidase
MDARYWDSTLPTKERVENLISLMTLEEKIAQLSGVIFPWGNFPVKIEEDKLIKSESYDEAVKNGLGGISYVNFSLQPEESVRYTNALQKDIRENTRLGIPIFVFEECLYGQIAFGSTTFPFPIGLGATWDPELVQEVFDVVGREVRCRGGLMTFNPILDIGRDPRWGRIREILGKILILLPGWGWLQ